MSKYKVESLDRTVNHESRKKGNVKRWLLLNLPHDNFLMPYGILYISAALKTREGVEVYTKNLTYLKESLHTFLEEMIFDKGIDVVAFGGYSWQCSVMRNLINEIRSVDKNILIVVGGGIITTLPVIAMEALEGADIGVIGEGEEAICELADALKSGEDISNMSGLVIKEENKWVLTKERVYQKDLDKKPIPDREGFDYSVFVQQSGAAPFFGIFASRSCPFGCTFCFHHEPYRKRSLDSIFYELDQIMEEYNHPSFIHFYDELFSVDIQRVKEFCRRIKPYNITYEIYLRVTDITKELTTMLKESGCVTIGIGLESHSNDILRSMNKRISTDDIDKALQILEECKVGVMGNFILGDPEDTEETIAESLSFRENHPEYNINIYMIRTLPGSAIYKYAVANNFIKDELEFLKNDCPYINISHLDDEKWKELWDKCIEENIYSDRYLTDFDFEPISFNSNNGFGTGLYTMICPKCLTRTILHTTCMKYIPKYPCKGCNSRYSADPLRAFEPEPYSFDKNVKYIMWGCNEVAYYLLKNYEYIYSDVEIVDKNPDLTGRIIFKKRICSTTEIQNAEAVIITALSAKRDIVQLITRQYPNIKKFIYPALMKKNGNNMLYLHEMTDAEIRYLR